MRQRVEGRNVGCLYVEGIIMDINQGTKQYTVQLASDEIVSTVQWGKQWIGKLSSHLAKAIVRILSVDIDEDCKLKRSSSIFAKRV